MTRRRKTPPVSTPTSPRVSAPVAAARVPAELLAAATNARRKGERIKIVSATEIHLDHKGRTRRP